mgnify:FL=1
MNTRHKINLIFSVFLAAVILIMFVLLFKNRKTSSDTTKTEKESYSFSFNPTELKYDGSGKFDPMIGVSVTDSKGHDVTKRVVTELKQTDKTERKKIEYRIYNRDGSYKTAERDLILENYSGPSVSFSGAGALFLAQTEDDLLSEILRLGLAKADDGYGNDITDSITVSFSAQGEGRSRAIVIRVENFLGDRAEVSSSVLLY